MARIIGIGGGSGCGKTTIVNKIRETVGDFAIIPQDNYYKTAEHVSNVNITGFNFDHPSAFDSALLEEHLRELRAERAVEMPEYDFVHHRRKESTITLNPGKLVLFEGIMNLL